MTCSVDTEVAITSPILKNALLRPSCNEFTMSDEIKACPALTLFVFKEDVVKLKLIPVIVLVSCELLI